MSGVIVVDSRVQGRKRHNGEPWAPNKKPSSVSQQHRDKALSKSEARASRFLANFAAITAELRSLDAENPDWCDVTGCLHSAVALLPDEAWLVPAAPGPLPPGIRDATMSSSLQWDVPQTTPGVHGSSMRDALPKCCWHLTLQLRKTQGDERDPRVAAGVLEWVELSVSSDFLSKQWLHGARRRFLARLGRIETMSALRRAVLQFLLQGLDLERLASLVHTIACPASRLAVATPYARLPWRDRWRRAANWCIWIADCAPWSHVRTQHREWWRQWKRGVERGVEEENISIVADHLERLELEIAQLLDQRWDQVARAWHHSLRTCRGPIRLGNLARKLFAHKRDPDDLTSSSSDEETAMKGWGAPSRPPRLSINPATMPPGVTLQARGSPRPSAYMRPSYVDSDETSSSDASSDPEVTSRRKIPIRKGALSPRATRPRAPPLAKMAKGAGERGGAGGHAEADSESSGRGVDISGEALDVVSEEVSEPDEGGGGPRERFWMRAKVQWWTDGMVPERPDSEEEPDMPDSWWIREDPADLFHLSEGPFRPASAPWGAHTDGRATANADASLETVRLSGGARNAGGHQEGRSGRVEEGIEGARGETGRGGTRAEERPDLSVLPRERAMWQPGVEATIWAGHRSAGYEEYVVSPDVASSSVRKQLVRTVRSLRRSKAGTLLMDEMDRSAAAKSPLGACMSAHLYYGSISTPAEVLPAPGMPPSRPRVDICQNVPRCTCGGAVLRAEQRRLRRKGKGRPARPEERSRCKSPVCARVVELEEPRKGPPLPNGAPSPWATVLLFDGPPVCPSMAPGRSDTDLECSCLSGSVSGLNLYSAFARRPEHVGHPAAAAPCVWGALAHLGGYIPWRLKVQRVAGKGLGCFAAELIPRGAVVMEYIGEVITTLLAERRMAAGARRDGPARVRDHSDHFNLHFRKLGAPAGAGHAPPAVVFTAVIDPSRRGNVARVMNHSCDGGCLEVCEVNPCQRGLRALPSLSSPTLLRRVGSHGWAPPALDGFDLVGSRGPHAPTPADEDCPRLWEDLSASARLGLWMPRIAFVAKRDIYPGEELTYNYNMFRGEDEQDDCTPTKRCLCGSARCTGLMA